MDNQHRKIKTYRELNQDEIDLMNEGKELAEKCREYIAKLDATKGIDQRWLADAELTLQKGFMSLRRAINKPREF